MSLRCNKTRCAISSIQRILIIADARNYIRGILINFFLFASPFGRQNVRSISTFIPLERFIKGISKNVFVIIFERTL